MTSTGLRFQARCPGEGVRAQRQVVHVQGLEPAGVRLVLQDIANLRIGDPLGQKGKQSRWEDHELMAENDTHTGVINLSIHCF